MVNWFVGNQHALGVFINFGKILLVAEFFERIYFPLPSLPTTQRDLSVRGRELSGSEVHDWKNAIRFVNLFLGKLPYYLFQQKMIS